MTLATARALALSLALLPALPALADDYEIVDSAIVLAVDVSGSMDAEELAVQREGYLDALRHPDFARIIAAGARGKIALSHFEWAGTVREASTVPWRLVDSVESLHVFAAEVESLPLRTSFGTSISSAIDYGVAIIDGAQFASDAWVIDVSGDGPNNMGAPVTEARDRALDKGITINGLPIVLRPSRGATDLAAYYEQCVIGGPGAFVLSAESPDEVAPAIRRKLFRELYGEPGGGRVWRAQGYEPIDCMVGERLRRERSGEF